MVVTKSKGPTIAIKILSIFMIPFSLFMIVACVIMLFTTNTIEETIAAIIFLLLFTPTLWLFLSLVSKAYKRNQNAVMIEGHEIVIDLGYRVIRFPISAIEYFSHTNHRGITVIKIKIRGKRKKRLLNLCNQVLTKEIYQIAVKDDSQLNYISGLYELAAISQYDITESYNYIVSKPNDYYLKMIKFKHNGQWLMDEDSYQ